MKTTVFKTSMLIAALQLTTQIQAQVTIGSLNEPAPAALLDLKQNLPNADNATVGQGGGGVVFPRVNLVDPNTLEPFISKTDNYWKDKETTQADKLHIGMMVYNMTDNAHFKPGIYVWSGEKWGPQVDDAWQLGGNSNAQNKFLGTTNSDPLIFKTNGEERIKIDAYGDIEMGSSHSNILINGSEASFNADAYFEGNYTMIASPNTFLTLPSSEDTNVSPVVVDNKGRAFKQKFAEGIKPINYIKYEITCNEMSGDFVRDLDTQISTADYTMVVVGAQLELLGTNLGLTVSALTDKAATYNPYTAFAFKSATMYWGKETWHLKADYIDGGISPVEANHTGQGKWHLYCLIIHNSLVNTLETIRAVATPDGRSNAPNGL